MRKAALASLREIGEQLRLVLAGRAGAILEAGLPTLAFLLGQRLGGIGLGLGLALGAGALVAAWRALRGEGLGIALGGLILAASAAGLALLNRNAADFFLPGLVSGAVLTLACLASLLIKRPLAAWSSQLARGWPLDWYWHPQVQPAYQTVTAFWTLVLGGRWGLQLYLYQRGAVEALARSQLLLGWPLILVVLILTYLYGSRKLRQLQGPSVEEFKHGAPPPWQGQQSGF